MIRRIDPRVPADREHSGMRPPDSDLASVYRTSPLLSFRLGTEHSLVYLLGDQQLHVVANDDLRLLSACGAFKTLEAHEQGCGRASNAPRSGGLFARLFAGARGMGGLRMRLQGLVEKRLLSPLSAIDTRTAVGSDAKRGLSWLTVPARGNLGDLTRCLRGYLGNAAAFGHCVPVLVSDDSADSGDRQHRRLEVRKAVDGSSVGVYYVDRVIRRNLADQLAQDRSIPKAIVDFGLFGNADGKNYGANRNAILLYTQGTLALSLDQDMTCRTGKVDATDGLLTCIGHDRAEDVWFCRDHDEALALAPSCDVDLLGEHERVLGASVSALIGDAIGRGAADLNQMCPHLLTDLSIGNGRVRITVNGLVGDCGSENSLWVRWGLTEASRRRLADQRQHHLALTSRQIVRQVRGLTISHGAPWGAMAYGFDNRTLLPPFLPTYRSEDSVWRVIVASYLTGNYFGHLPWTLTHAPGRVRSYQPVEAISVLHFADLAVMCLSTKQVLFHGPVDASHTLRSLGALLVEFGTLKQADFNESMRLLACHHASALMEHLERQRQVASSEGDRVRADDLAAQARLLEEAVVRSDYWVPADLCSGEESAGPAETARDTLRQYGELLWWWPAIAERGKQLLESGAVQPDRLN